MRKTIDLANYNIGFLTFVTNSKWFVYWLCFFFPNPYIDLIWSIEQAYKMVYKCCTELRKKKSNKLYYYTPTYYPRMALYTYNIL